MSVAKLKPTNDVLAEGPEALLSRAAEAVAAADKILALAKTGVAARVKELGSIDAAQAAAHGLAWLATYVEALRQMLGWASRLRRPAAPRRDRAPAARRPPSASTWPRSPAASP